MTFVRSLFAVAALTTASLAAAVDQHDSHHPAQTPAVQVAQATPTAAEIGTGAGAAMPGYTDPMKAMRDMHDAMLAAKKPEERSAPMLRQARQDPA